jgi:transcriptional regulator with XRE-family HTH domain
MTIQEAGHTLSRYRKQYRLSQAYVAELAGISSRQLLEWEAGRGNPSFNQLQAVLEVLGLALKIEPKQVS